jgi:hypothetical protein
LIVYIHQDTDFVAIKNGKSTSRLCGTTIDFDESKQAPSCLAICIGGSKGWYSRFQGGIHIPGFVADIVAEPSTINKGETQSRMFTSNERGVNQPQHIDVQQRS